MLFKEVKVRLNGREDWVDSMKWFKEMLKEYNKVSYSGKSVNPYDVRVKNFYNNIPDDLIIEWAEAFPNVDISTECKKARGWLISNPQKAKSNFKGYTYNWLARASQNGGSIPVQTDAKIEYQIKKQKEFERSREDGATPQTLEEKIKMLENENSILSDKLSVAIEGLQAIIVQGDFSSIAKKTIEAINKQ